jgi:hypothetical protein
LASIDGLSDDAVVFFEIGGEAGDEEGIADHAGNKGSQINVRVARNALVDEIDESEAEARLGDDWDVADFAASWSHRRIVAQKKWAYSWKRMMVILIDNAII